MHTHFKHTHISRFDHGCVLLKCMYVRVCTSTDIHVECIVDSPSTLCGSGLALLKFSQGEKANSAGKDGIII